MRHPTETSAYWRRLARDAQAFAQEARGRRGDVESIAIYERDAKDYEARAAALDASTCQCVSAFCMCGKSTVSLRQEAGKDGAS